MPGTFYFFNVRIDDDLNPAVIDRIINQGLIHFDSNMDGRNEQTSFTDSNDLISGEQTTEVLIPCPVVEIRNISLKKTVRCNDEIEYLVEVTNISEITAKNLIINSIYDPKVEFISSFPEPDEGTYAKWTLGNLAAGETSVIRIKVKMRYRLPYLYVVKFLTVLQTICDTQQVETRTNILGCGPR